MEHDINLNIHYTAPKEIWEKIDMCMLPCRTGQEIKMNRNG